MRKAQILIDQANPTAGIRCICMIGKITPPIDEPIVMRPNAAPRFLRNHVVAYEADVSTTLLLSVGSERARKKLTQYWDEMLVIIKPNTCNSTLKKRAADIDSKGLYLDEIKSSPGVAKLLVNAELVSDLKSASDWSYSAPAYASPYVRLAGDAACFIDPFFSYGVHLALASGLSAAVTICASIKGQCSEPDAATWHSKKDEPDIADWDEKTFDRAFNHFRPIIQGTTDIAGKLSQTEVSKTVDFCFHAFVPVSLADKQNLLDKMSELGIRDPSYLNDEEYARGAAELESILSPEQMHIMHTIRARQMLRSEDTLNIDTFGTDVIDGLSPNLVTGSLGLQKPRVKAVQQPDVLALMSGEEPKIETNGASDPSINGTEDYYQVPSEINGYSKGSNGVNNTKRAHDLNDGGSIHLKPLTGHVEQSNETTRLGMQDTLRRVAEEMETPHDIMLRMFNSPKSLEVSVVVSVLNLGIFKKLSKSTSPLNLKSLADPTVVDPLLLGRLMRYLSSIRMVSETSKDHFAANNATRAFSDPRVEGALKYTFHIGGPTYQALPEFLEKHKYQNHTGGKFAWNMGANTDLDFFSWAQQNQQSLQWFQQLMSVPREDDWLDVVPVISEGMSDVILVDVGGGMGQQCARLVARFPELENKVVLQDRPETIKIAPPIKGVKAMGHDFFTPQVVNGAQFYYLRTVLHDWEDDEAVQILKNLIPAMAPGSKILIDEMVLPNTGVHWWSACLDLHMYAMLGAMERNEEQWHSLLDKAGLQITEISTYSPVMRHSIIVAQPK
ncbi:hypothetical protein NHQ30_002301 [Ciborinia camelliae]|nr:hypothetical protein NHQ30_002301 [Ciborinia camelliae]